MTYLVRLVVGLLAALSLGACSPGLGGSADDSPSSTAHRDAQSIRDDFYTEIGEITQEAGGTWTYLDGSPFSPKDRDWFNPKACRGDEDSRQLLLLVQSEPAKDGPAAIKRMKPLLEARGMTVSGYIPGTSRKEASTIYAESPTGFFVAYGTTDLKTSVRFGSDCSSHPSMLKHVS